MKCLVTGGAGFVGSNLALALEKKGHKVTVIDNLSSGHKDNLKGFNGRTITSNIADDPLPHDRFEAIFHQAAITDPRFDDDQEMIRQNVNGFDNILKKARTDRSKLIYASTASLYGNGKAPQKEDQPKEILSAYGQSKLIMDEMASHHYRDMHIVGLRYFNVFGPKEEYKGRAASMIYHLLKQMKSGKNPRIFKNGDQKRDHIYVKDCVLANILALKAASGIYNVGTGKATSFNELIKVLNQLLDKSFAPEYFDMPYPKHSYQDHTEAEMTKANKDLAFVPQYDLISGIKDYLEVFS